MALSDGKPITYNEFVKLRENSELKVEYIDGVVYMPSAPSPKHQKVCYKITRSFDDYFKGSKCEVLQGINLRLYDEAGEKIGDVIPDISMFCDYKNLSNTYIEDIPTIVVEIVSPSTVYIDNVKKLELFKRVGVREYWIVDIKSNHIIVWDFIKIEQFIYHDEVKSSTFDDLTIDLIEIFED